MVMSCKGNLNNFISIVESPCHTNAAFKGTLFFIFFYIYSMDICKIGDFFFHPGGGMNSSNPRFWRFFFSLVRSSKITQSKHANFQFRTFVGRNFTINLQVARLATFFVHERKPTFLSLHEKLKKKKKHI